MMRLYEIPFSTNVERVTLALALKGLDVDHVVVDPADRGPVVELSGQPLVPVLVLDGGAVVADSTAILRRLDHDHPHPPLWPGYASRAAASAAHSAVATSVVGRNPAASATGPTSAMPSGSVPVDVRKSKEMTRETRCSGTRDWMVLSHSVQPKATPTAARPWKTAMPAVVWPSAMTVDCSAAMANAAASTGIGCDGRQRIASTPPATAPAAKAPWMPPQLVGPSSSRAAMSGPRTNTQGRTATW